MEMVDIVPTGTCFRYVFSSRYFAMRFLLFISDSLLMLSDYF